MKVPQMLAGQNGEPRPGKRFGGFHYKLFKHVLARCVFFLYLSRYHYADKAQRRFTGPAIVVSNHCVTMDPVLLLFTFPRARIRFLCAAEIYKQCRFLGRFLPFIGCIPVDRAKPSLKSVATMTDVLAEGDVVGIFPEGRIETDGEVIPFKAGMVMIALKAGVPILPVYMEHKSKLVTDIYVGELMDLTALAGEHPSIKRIDELCAHVQNAVLGLAPGGAA